jgi:hypothetical protein
MHEEQTSLENKNHDLSAAFTERCKAHSKVQKMYQTLKAELMANQAADAAAQEADFAVNTARADRYIDRIPGTRMGTGDLGHLPSQAARDAGRQHNRNGSGNLGGVQPPRDVRIGGAWNTQSQSISVNDKMFTDRKSYSRSSLGGISDVPG